MDTYCQRRKPLAESLVSGIIRFVRIFGRVFQKEEVKDSGVARHAHVLRSHAEVYSLCA